MRCVFLINSSNGYLLLLVIVVIMVTPFLQGIVTSTPTWAKPGVYFTYYIVGKLKASPPPQEGMENYVVVGHGRFFGLKVNETGIMGYYELLDLNDTKNYFTRILGMPGYKINSFINWSTEYSSHKFNIYVDPRTIPSTQKVYENITAQEDYVYYTRIKSTYDKNTGILLEYYYFTEANNTIENRRYVYELHYKLIDTNVEELYKVIGKTHTIVTTNAHGITTTTYEENPGEKETIQTTNKYPIEYVAYLIAFILLGSLIYYIVGRRK